ncbi:MAG TPA: 3-phosphoserine/phosphohydroxythreonine transaminase [Fimbriimonas sp.]|nr:3-phosphoserine/phosphohydroxythreonine transaminase [Fimbriimonas sp.]
MAQPYNRIYNFSAGPSTLPVPVLERARDEMLNYGGSGMGVMEMSHRSKAYEAIIHGAEQDLRTLMGIPDNYRVLFLQGGASMQFSMVPMAFLRGGTADYVVTGSWGKKAVEAGNLEGKATVLWDGKAGNYSDVVALDSLGLSSDAKYLHFTSNETIQGVEYHVDPKVSIPLICDMSSDICSRPVDVSKYDLIYAGAQKNMGPAGTTLVIVNDEFLAKAPDGMHPMLDYKLQAENESMYNTPPTFGVYLVGLVTRYLLDNGGLEGALKRNREKAQVLYDAIDGSGGFFKGHAAKNARSLMNVTFTLPDEDLTKEFIKLTESQGLDGLKGHRSVGGCRASIYNAFPLEGCQALAEAMRGFAAAKG